MSMTQRDLRVSSLAVKEQTPNRRLDCTDQNMICESEVGKDIQG